MVKPEEITLGGNIALVGFGVLQPMELIVVKKIVGTYVKKLQEQGNYIFLKLVLQVHKHSPKHAKYFLHEITGEAIMKKEKSEAAGKEAIIAASTINKNLFSALSEVMEEIIAEAGHRIRRVKEEGEKILRNKSSYERKFTGAEQEKKTVIEE